MEVINKLFLQLWLNRMIDLVLLICGGGLRKVSVTDEDVRNNLDLCIKWVDITTSPVTSPCWLMTYTLPKIIIKLADNSTFNNLYNSIFT